MPQRRTAPTLPIHFAVVTALPKERDALIRRCPGVFLVRDEHLDIRSYHLAELPLASGASYGVAIVLLSDMGNVDAVSATKDLLQRWNPMYLVMLGIAAGFPVDGLGLGDVVVADQVFEYEYAKIRDRRSESRTRVHRADALLLDRVRAGVNRVRPAVRARPDGKTQRPKVFVGPVASGNKVVASTKFRNNLRKLHPKLLAIDMESEGVMAAAWQRPQPVGVMVVRGISDMGDRHKGDLWQAYASRAAAAFLVSFLKTEPIQVATRGGPFVIGLHPDALDRFYR